MNIEDSLLVINENMQENVLNIMELCRMWNMIIKTVVLFLFIIFIMLVVKKKSSKRFHVTNKMNELWRMTFY